MLSLKQIWQKIVTFFTSKQAQDVITTGISLINDAEPIIAAFADASGNTTLQSVVAGYQKYGLPVSQALQDGKLTSDEVKSLAGLGVQMALQQLTSNGKITGTSAGIAAVLAFAKAKYDTGTVTNSKS